MSDALRAKGRDYAKLLETLSPAEIARSNEVNYRNAEEEFNRFYEHFETETCYLCEKPSLTFSKKSSCPHWLLKPKEFKKNDLPALAERYGFYQIQTFLRWVANHEAFARNINDIAAEGTGNKLFEVTIKYKNLEWAFSCAESDYQGHATTQHAKHSHYHFQMRIDRRLFINYRDFQPPFSDIDVINIEAMRAQPEKMKQRFSFGEGMNALLSDKTVEHIVNTTVHTDDEDGAPFKIDTIAGRRRKNHKQGRSSEIIQEAKAKGVTVASLMHKLPNARTQVIVSPGPGVVEQAPRTGRKRDA
jgi:hypothetical protein